MTSAVWRITTPMVQEPSTPSAQRNAKFAPDSGIINGPLDFLRTDIAAILAGERPSAADAPRQHMIEL